METVDDGGRMVHVAMLPWLAMGHILPYLHLAKRLSTKGIRVSFISTPKNIATILTKLLPPPAATAINFISIPFPDGAESSTDVKTSNQPLLKAAFHKLRHPVAGLLHEARPDFILYDFLCSWIPGIAAEIGASCAHYSIVNASFLSFLGPMADGRFDDDTQGTMLEEALTRKPDWIPFESSISYRHHEVQRFFSNRGAADPDEGERIGRSIGGGDFIAVKTCYEIESRWIDLLSKLYSRPVIPVGPLYPASGDGGDVAWSGGTVGIKEWLDEQGADSVLYVALGTEVVLSQEELAELAHGLEDSRVPFLWVLRNPPESARSAAEMLPVGFEGRVKGRGLVYTEWAPQVSILGHRAVRGFLTHCGWGSVIEGLGSGRVLVLLPVINDQPLVARFLEEEGLGVEIPRRERDGWSLVRGEVAETVQVAMVAEEGATLRGKARGMKDIIGSGELNDRYVSDFVDYLKRNRKGK